MLQVLPILLAAIWVITSCSAGKTNQPQNVAAQTPPPVETKTASNSGAATYTDFRDGKIYKYVIIGDQVWMAENLNYEAAGSKCYDDNPENCAKYGRLYNWETAMNACPAGWHLPTRLEWEKLYDYVDNNNPRNDRKMVGKHLKFLKDSLIFVHISGMGMYILKTADGRDSLDYGNEYGFSALLGGYYNSRKDKFSNGVGYWWSASYYDPVTAYSMSMKYGYDDAYLNYSTEWENLNSVRCLANNSPDAPSSSSSAVVECPKHDSSTSFCDSRNGKIYKTATIGSQIWMAENLNYEAQYNGSACYDNKPENCEKYGRVYLWKSATKVCPKGWHLPSDTEWETLANYIENDKKCTKCDGKHLKAASGWDNKGNGKDSYGFSALPGRYRYGPFSADYGKWWTSSDKNFDYAYSREIYTNHESVAWDSWNKYFKLSVRCLNDSTVAISSSSGSSSSATGNTFTDSRDGKVYRYVKIGKQAWMAENLAYNAEGSKCTDREDKTDCRKQGRFYDWNTAMTVCPEGWHLPTTKEWNVLIDFAGGEKKAGKKIKAKNSWSKNGYGTDDYGFSALSRNGQNAHWWSASGFSNSYKYTKYVSNDYDSFYSNSTERDNLFNVRCLQGSPPPPPPPVPPKPDGNVFTDPRDGKQYRTVEIGTQTWMAENLNYEDKEYKNNKGYDCYAGKLENCDKYGRLYNWDASLNVCPAGWHLPSDTEWKTLVNFAGGEKKAGKKLKAKGGWYDNNGKSGNGTDDFGFAALPGGYDGNRGGEFQDLGYTAEWWTSSKYKHEFVVAAHKWSIYHNKDIAEGSSPPMSYMYSVRCVKD